MCVRNEKIKLIETNISKEKELIERINTNLSVNQKKTSLNHYQIDTVTLNENTGCIYSFYRSIYRIR